jgi:hypothetical protein
MVTVVTVAIRTIKFVTLTVVTFVAATVVAVTVVAVASGECYSYGFELDKVKTNAKENSEDK